MSKVKSTITRRNFVRGSAAAGAALWTTGVFAEELTITPQLTEGPFYPDKLPLDTDNDLIVINNATSPALGEITHLGGRILSKSGAPVRNAVVEIWQVDHKGVYLHSSDRNRAEPDDHFQGYGRFLTDSEGRYYFRTVKPVPYPGRTPHVHFAISRNGKRIYTTQMLVKGHPQNANDGVVRNITDPKIRAMLMGDFLPVEDSQIGELAVNWDIRMGITPEDDHAPVQGGIGKPEYRGRGGGRGRA